MITGIVLVLMCLFASWACAHTERRAAWWQDEQDAEAFLAALRAAAGGES